MNLSELQKKYNLQELEIYNQLMSNYNVSFAANKLKQTETTHRKGSAIRLLKDKKIGFSSSYGSSDEIESLIKKAIEISKFSPETNFTLPANFSKNEKKTEGISVKNSLDKFNNIGQELIECIFEKIQNKKKSILVDLSFDIGTLSETIANSKNLNCSFSEVTCSFSINLRDTRENNFVEIFTACEEREMPDFKKYTEEVIGFYNFSQKEAKVENGSYPVLFTSRAAKELLDVVETALNGKQFIQQSTPWFDKLGEKVLSDKITLRQNPLEGYMSRTFDDEGSLVQDLILIDKGILKNFYFDILTGEKTNGEFKSTGSGFRPSLASAPEPILLNLILEEGNKSLAEIIKTVDYGLLVDQTIGGLSSNISGDISVNVDLGFLIKNGEIIGRVKDTMVSGNVYNVLNNVIELSNDRKWYWSTTYNPDMLLDGFSVVS